MKKLMLSLLAVVGLSAGASAMNLKDAFAALYNLPNVSVVKPDYNMPVSSTLSDDGDGVAAAYNLNAEQIGATGDATMAILNQVPLNYLINGGGNGEVMAMVYSMPTGEGKNDVLVAVLSGYRGLAFFMYGTDIDDAVCEALQSAPLKIEGNFLSLETTLPDGNEFNIILSKAR